MIRAVKAVSSQRGRDPRKFTLFAFGGSGPVHAAGIARELEIGRIVVPRAPASSRPSACSRRDLEHHAMTHVPAPHARRSIWPSWTLPARRRSEPTLRAGFGPIATCESDQVQVERWVEMRYVGQAFELPVAARHGELKPRPGRTPRRGVPRRPRADVRPPHGQRDGDRQSARGVPRAERCCAADRARRREQRPCPPRGSRGRRTSARSTESATRRCCVASTCAKSHWPGPLVIEEYDATVVVPPGCSAARDVLGNIVIEVES